MAASSSSSISSSDMDLAFELQLQEAMTDSLLQSQLDSLKNPIDPETLELLLKFEQERKDSEKWEFEMQTIKTQLQIRNHDQKFARELHQIPEDYWVKHGDHVEKPFDEESKDLDGGEPFKLYFKGLCNRIRVHDEMVLVAGIGAAVCDPRGNLMFSWEEKDLQLKIDLKALMEGLNAAVSLGIKKIDFFCEFHPLFQNMTARWLINQQNIATVVDQVLLLQRKFTTSRPFFIARNDVRYAFKLARGSLESQITRSTESSLARNTKQTCNICLEDTDVAQMFAIDTCSHRYCLSCMKQHVEVKLLHGMTPKCPHEGCNTVLTIPICRKFLPSDLIDLMNQRTKESSIPATEKVYCPYPKCSVLMSRAEVLPYTNGVRIGIEQSMIKKCIQCRGLFCINCKVPWHNGLSCYEYKMRNPNPTVEDAKLKSLANTKSWRQCKKCSHMIELAEGCYHITCRCGYEFCYTCGAEWRNKKATCNCKIWDERNIVNNGRPERNVVFNGQRR
ncbi:RBR-type E3 ubiquitin transferase [Ranunculus cassubicifolius]